MFRVLMRVACPSLLILLLTLFTAGCRFGDRTQNPPVSGGTSSPPASGGEPVAPEKEGGGDPGSSQEIPLPGLIMVSVSNGAAARPQSGVNQASIVFEVPTEGGISRLLLGFTEHVDRIGPVRSVRKSMVELALGYGAPFGHCGASNDAYALIRDTRAPSLDDIRTAGGCFWRDGSGDPPDNLYTSTANLLRFARALGFELPGAVQFPEKAWEGEPATYVEYDFSWLPSYPNVVTYVFEEGKYVRSQGGKRHHDSDGVSMAPENLVFMEVKTEFVKGEAIEVNLQLTGEGRAIFFSQGQAKEGTWAKRSLRSPVEFYIGQDRASFAGGQVWVHVVRDLSLMKYR